MTSHFEAMDATVRSLCCDDSLLRTDILSTSGDSEDASKREGGRPGLPGVFVGRLTEITAAGEAWVCLPDAPPGDSVPARSITPLQTAAVGDQVALLFEGGDRRRPIIVGVVQHPQPDHARCITVDRDGERLTLTAADEIVLRCGRASITLTKSGKILVRGAYVLTEAAGVNRIRGGSVQIN